MNFPPASVKTAFLAGIWTGTVSLVFLFLGRTLESVATSDKQLLIVFLVGVVPVFPFIFNMDRKPDGGSISTRIRGGLGELGGAAKRALVWMFGVAVVHLPLSLLNALEILREFPV